MESNPQTVNPVILGLTSEGTLKAATFICQGKMPAIDFTWTLAQEVSHFDYVVMDVDNSPTLFIFYATAQTLELKVSAFKVNSNFDSIAVD